MLLVVVRRVDVDGASCHDLTGGGIEGEVSCGGEGGEGEDGEEEGCGVHGRGVVNGMSARWRVMVSYGDSDW